MKASIRLARLSDLKNYSDMLQRTYQEAYAHEKIGLTKDCFSKKVFSSTRIQNYFKGNLTVSDKRKTWLFFLGTKLIGSITITDKGKEYELTGFYVAPEHQGQGIGKKLWKKALSFARNKDIILDLFAHNPKTLKTIEMYKRWGFKVDKEKGSFYRHKPEWPKGIKAKCIYMRLQTG